jgi:hypothetical protein
MHDWPPLINPGNPLQLEQHRLPLRPTCLVPSQGGKHVVHLNPLGRNQVREPGRACTSVGTETRALRPWAPRPRAPRCTGEECVAGVQRPPAALAHRAACAARAPGRTTTTSRSPEGELGTAQRWPPPGARRVGGVHADGGHIFNAHPPGSRKQGPVATHRLARAQDAGPLIIELHGSTCCQAVMWPAPATPSLSTSGPTQAGARQNQQPL